MEAAGPPHSVLVSGPPDPYHHTCIPDTGREGGKKEGGREEVSE